MTLSRNQQTSALAALALVLCLVLVDFASASSAPEPETNISLLRLIYDRSLMTFLIVYCLLRAFTDVAVAWLNRERV